jgi:hypothetical protein
MSRLPFHPEYEPVRNLSERLKQYIAGEICDCHDALRYGQQTKYQWPAWFPRTVAAGDPLTFHFLHCGRSWLVRLVEGSEPLVDETGALAQFRDLAAEEIAELSIAPDPLAPANRLTI